MRTTLTLDEDVARELQEQQRQQRRSMKELVNQALREGLARLSDSRRTSTLQRTEPLDVGRCRLPNIDSIAETLALSEGDDFR